MEIGDIYIYKYVHVCIVFSMVARQTARFTRAGVALTNAVDSSIAHTLWKKRNQREGGNGIEKPDRMNRKYDKQKKTGWR